MTVYFSTLNYFTKLSTEHLEPWQTEDCFQFSSYILISLSTTSYKWYLQKKDVCWGIS